MAPIRQEADEVIGAIRAATKELHLVAERSGIVREMLRGTISRRDYALYLANLLPVYRALEGALDDNREKTTLHAVARPELYRTHAIMADLSALNTSASGWAPTVLPESIAYAARIARAARGDGAGLIGHSYVRYLGDLSGGQILCKRLMATLNLDADALNFYRFPLIPDPDLFKAEFLQAIGSAAILADPGHIVDEAVTAFHFNIALSDAVLAKAKSDDTAWKLGVQHSM